MTLRASGLKSIHNKPTDDRFKLSNFGKPISDYFGKLVFGKEAKKKYIISEAYESLMKSLETGEPVDRKTADFVAIGMKNWAMDQGATHFTHWFQPMTGKTAEKHDAFFKFTSENNIIEDFSGSTLIQQEPDGSSFPNGGLRETHQARGYTVWDPSSPAFIRETKGAKVLCIPAIFISYTGESLDLKTPLLKSIHVLDIVSTNVLKKYFDDDVKKVTPTLGCEQEYFVVDESLFNARPDLVQCGRTLFGNASARGQQLDDHYFGSIPERVQDFMLDFETEALELGIPISTRHNEVAPNQYECAPIFESVNIAADHNQFLMELLDRVARRHQLRILLHEKPFAGLNGSGKHSNWSLQTDSGENLLTPGDDPLNNLKFLTFFINVIAAIDTHAELLHASIATVGNEHRLGANEAPPAIISVYTGDFLEKVLNAFIKNETELDDSSSNEINLNIAKISTVKLDNTDRNRTSPFPFTGNKFEFRAVGSSVNTSNPMTVMNVILAEQLKKFDSAVESKISEGCNKEEAIKKVLIDIYKKSEKRIFNGNNYSDEWVAEAERRGLSNIKSSPEALKAYLSESSKKLFIENEIFTENEIVSRFNVHIEEYIHRLEIESLLVEEIANTYITPAVVNYQNRLIKNVQGLKNIGLIKESENHKTKLIQISDHLEGIISGLSKLEEERKIAQSFENDYDTANSYFENVKPLFDVIRHHADKLELLVDDKHWPLPKYREILFLH